MATIDYTYTDLSDNEIAQDMERKRKAAEAEAKKDKARMAKARNFHFGGGML